MRIERTAYPSRRLRRAFTIPEKRAVVLLLLAELVLATEFVERFDRTFLPVAEVKVP